MATSTVPPDVTPEISTAPDPTPKSLTAQQTISSAADAEN